MAGVLGRLSEVVAARPWVFVGIPVVFVGAAGLTYSIRSNDRVLEGKLRESAAGIVKPCPHGAETYEEWSKSFDKDLDAEERVLLMPLIRKFLVKKAEGVVLEVSAGTGRNVEYYDAGKVRSVSLLDRSAGMLDVAKRKVDGLEGIKWRTVVGDAEALPFADSAFDTVVDTFGLCSMDSPVSALREMRRVCKPDGKILLLEHGRGTWDIVNYLLDRNAQKHADKFGCWYNRDIPALIAASGLRVVSRTRWHFGTTLVYECARN